MWSLQCARQNELCDTSIPGRRRRRRYGGGEEEGERRSHTMRLDTVLVVD
jgi:hypothetical protein